MLLEVEKIKKSYKVKNNIVEAVKSIDFRLESRNITAFLGPNGAGKTTTIKMIAGLIHPDYGDIRINGKSVINKGRFALKDIGAVLEGSRNLYWRLTPLENFEYWGGIKGVSRLKTLQRGKELMSAFGLESKLNSTVQQLSRGMQQQVAICTALIHSPSLLLLDEPTLGLDLEASDRIQSLLEVLAKEQEVGILLTTHQMDVAERLSDSVAIINNGQIIKQGFTKNVLKQFSSGETYIFEYVLEIPSEKRELLSKYRPEYINLSTFKVVLTDAQTPYEIIDLLEPYSILRVERDSADLATVFRFYTSNQKN
ncbi:ABC transporter ATP-binding protein [Oceanobacillus profundus]|uniref:ABC transporter ATP-binding protein n=1 Tax=Oceanobacillus profundus TaxID=372463 RepID=UPI000BA52BEE|nr:ABC transporter ATP-binding protein [Oceanobacillus profundus]MBR3119313.1 ABC transporter ATP-binding protein [Oceanobacillus sp.]MCM3400214.1 ABC transporter ATP-binding protein [Oceanobacillus profundus]PAE30949.1 hypothetical protein CHI07_01620 [Paenibacillus sp. 7884-2]